MIRRFRTRLALPVAGLLALFAALLTLAVVQTAREADRVDIERSRDGVRATIATMVERVAANAYDNAVWDDAARAAYARPLDGGFFDRAYASAARERLNYDAYYAIDADGRIMRGFDGSRIVSGGRADAIFAPLIERLSRQKSAAGLSRLGGHPVIIGVAPILPLDPALKSLVPRAGPSIFVEVRRLTPAVIAAASRNLMLDDLRLGGGEARVSVTIADWHAKAALTLSWRPRRPGREAMYRALPVLAAALALVAAMAMVLMRSGLDRVRNLARQALVDSLSGLPNRRALRRTLREAGARGEIMTLALLDLDGFKAINDNYGHAVGDRLIRAVSDTLRGLSGAEVMVARLGGDEFALLARGIDSTLEMARLCDTVLARLALPFYVNDRTLMVGASIGIADNDDCAPLELLRRADVAMYAAKRDGRMRANRFDAELDARQAAKHRIELELRAAIVDEAFRVVYQPQFSADRRRMTGVEALVRWTSPTIGEVPPEIFVPIAEESGLIDRIGLFVLRRACTEARAWPGLRLAVNVSAAQLRNPDFSRRLAHVLMETGYPAANLEIEITETYLVREAEAARRVLDELRALGVSISLDDFGTGFASIGFLRQFTFDKLKIDRSLVADAEHSDAARALVQASVAVARALDMPVTAEGVETQAQADLMNVVGCDQLQGWLFARASTAQGVTDAVSRASPSPPNQAVR